MTQTKYVWPDHWKPLLESLPVLINNTTSVWTKTYLIKDEDDLVSHLVHFAKVIVAEGVLREYPMPSLQEFYRERMGFGLGFYEDVFNSKPAIGFIKDIKEQHNNVIKYHNQEVSRFEDIKYIKEVAATGQIDDPHAIWTILSNYMYPGADQKFINFQTLNTI